MDSLTPARRLFRPRGHEHRLTRASLPASRVVPSDRSVSNHPWPPSEFGLLSLRGLPRNTRRIRSAPPLRWVGSIFGLRLSLASSARPQAESSSSSYGPVVRLRLLPTPSRDDAVTFGYKVQTEPWQRLAPCRFNAPTSALVTAFMRSFDRTNAVTTCNAVVLSRSDQW